MAKKLLNVVATAYRGTLEEQDDTILWLSHAMQGAGAALDVLLEGNAVNYAVRGQDASGLCFGERRQTQPPRIDEDVAQLAAKGVRVLAIAEDLDVRGIPRGELVEGIEPISRAEIPGLFSAYDLVCRW